MDFTPYTDHQLQTLRRDIARELDRRRTIASADTTVAETIRSYQDALGRTDGDPWTQPTGYLDAYLKDAVVTHDGAEWESLLDGNTLEPGVSGWRETGTDDSDGPPEWREPAGYQDAYNKGDQVTFEGAVYESLIDGNTWSPTVAPQVWKEITP